MFFVAGAAYLINPHATLGNLMGYVLKRPDSGEGCTCSVYVSVEACFTLREGGP